MSTENEIIHQLRTHLQRAEMELGQAKTVQQTMVHLHNSQRNRMKLDMLKYGNHTHECRFEPQPEEHIVPSLPCDCGWERIASAIARSGVTAIKKEPEKIIEEFEDENPQIEPSIE